MAWGQLQQATKRAEGREGVEIIKRPTSKQGGSRVVGSGAERKRRGREDG